MVTFIPKFFWKHLRISQEGDVDVVGDGDDPEGIAEQGGDEPVPADDDVVEEQLNEVKNHQEREEGAKFDKKIQFDVKS